MRGRRVVLLGLGRFGGQLAAARWFCEAGARVLVTDLKPASALADSLARLEGLPIEFRLGGHDERDLLGADLVCVSPAVPRQAPLRRLLAERAIPWTTEMNLAAAALPAPPLGVTGSNGKTTTASLLASALAAGLQRRVHLGGNMGQPLLGRLHEIGSQDLVVLELSSFQLEDLRDGPGIRPQLALITNVLPNHLDRHGTLEAYVACKRTLVEGLGPEGLAVLNREDPIVRSFEAVARRRGARVVTFGLRRPPRGAGAAAFLAQGRLVYRDETGAERCYGEAAALRLCGRHNLANVLAVVAACGALGARAERVAAALAAFRPLPHRLELVAEHGGVLYVNDSKATTPEAAAAAVQAYAGRAVLLAGGAGKGTSLLPLARAAVAARARAVIAYGQCRAEIAAAVATAAAAAPRRPGARPPVEVCEGLEEAFVRAQAHARPGSVVLLSPGCASYDQYLCYEERGAHFRRLVGEWLARRPAGR
ncbi:MAG: UDP-N-acetylmuramoylalanine--D-glutamate ligase [Planctomycetota bacterium]|nr:MAG: UDP-N-acetylmuramoylalanine--D-glutamate ligase [Planctomycetota bacterium]